MSQNEQCCPEFHPEKWQDQNFRWDKKLFIRESVPTFLHIPYQKKLTAAISRLCKAAEEANAMDSENFILVSEDISAFKSHWYLSVKHSIPGEDNVVLSGDYLSKVYDGPYKSIHKFIKETEKYAKENNKSINKHLLFYPYCPKCAEKYGHNYIVDIAQV